MMLRCTLAVLALFSAHGMAHGHENAPHFLCEADEQLVFGCSLGERQVSVCASADLGPDTGYVQYRLGTPERLEQVYPVEHLPPRGRFFLSTAPYAGGGASAIRLSIAGSDYFVFEQTTRTNFAPGEPHDPEFSAGLVTRREGTAISVTLCEDNDASIRRVAYDHFPREAYSLDTLP